VAAKSEAARGIKRRRRRRRRRRNNIIMTMLLTMRFRSNVTIDHRKEE
jgi:hypothetical protein